MAAQTVDDVDRATGRLAEALLPVLDAAEAAYLQHPDEIGPLLNVMLTELKKHGLETLDLEGQPFDPEVADAVTHEPGRRRRGRGGRGAAQWLPLEGPHAAPGDGAHPRLRGPVVEADLSKPSLIEGGE